MTTARIHTDAQPGPCNQMIGATTAPPVLSDAELCAAMKAGRTAADALLRRHLPFVVKMVHGLKLPPHVSRDDLIQHGLLALARAALSYRPDSGNKFITYGATCVSNAIRREAGHESRKVASLNSPLPDEDCQILDLLPARATPEPPDELLSRIDQLPALYRQIVVAHFGIEGSPVSWGPLAAALGLSVSQAKRALEVALARLTITIGGIMVGSANLRTNRNWEQLAVTRDIALHNWHAEWIDRLVNTDGQTRADK